MGRAPRPQPRPLVLTARFARRRPGPAPSPEPAGTAARRAALRLLHAVLARGVPLDAAIDGAFQGLANPSDRALARLLASASLRWLPDLDRLIDGATARALPDDAKARMVLRIALAGRLVLGTPPHAAVATALPLVEGGPRRLVHGVLGALLRGAPTLPSVPTLPQPWSARWGAAYSIETAEAAARLLGAEPPLDLTLRDPADGERLAADLGGNGLMRGHLRVAAKGAVAALPGYAEGAWWVQDLAASLPARLLRVRADERVLDLCAAPGGKTLQLAAAGAQVTAVDSSGPRLERLADNLARTSLTAEVVQADLTVWAPPGPADAILLDAPCSGTGIFRRHPDVLHLKGALRLGELTALQATLARRAAGWLRPGGRMVFCTCSLEREEGERQVEALLTAAPDLRLDPVAPHELPAGLVPAPEGWVRTRPGDLESAGGLDGFFMARLTRS